MASSYQLVFCGQCGSMLGVMDHLSINLGAHYRPGGWTPENSATYLCEYEGPWRMVRVVRASEGQAAGRD